MLRNHYIYIRIIKQLYSCFKFRFDPANIRPHYLQIVTFQHGNQCFHIGHHRVPVMGIIIII